MEKSDELRRGWTTGACATAATKAALTALLGDDFPDPVQITLPKGQTPSFALAFEQKNENFAAAGIIKDAGDDPDVTHGAMIKSEVRHGAPGTGVVFRGGIGVGQVTRPGLPIDVGEPAINPVPRGLMRAVVEELAAQHAITPDFEITISVPTGEKLAAKTWNPRLGILGGISILGTTGIVVPFSCSAWIHSIHRGIDVARAEGLAHVAGSTGSTSEKVVQALYDLPDFAMLDMGDFVGGLLKYLRKNPVDRLTIGGGFAKLCKLAQGHMDLHSGRSQVDFDWLAAQVATLQGVDEALLGQIRSANTALEVLTLCKARGLPIADHIAYMARDAALEILRTDAVAIDILVVSRSGELLARTAPAQTSPCQDGSTE